MNIHNEIKNPEEELKRLNRVIHQYEVVLRTTVNKEQSYRVKKKLREFKKYRDSILAIFDINQDSLDNEKVKIIDDISDYKYLKEILKDYIKEKKTDYDILHIDAYLYFFEIELLSIFSERNIKLDFKYSLDRDNFYHRFQEILRKVDDYKLGCVHIKNMKYQKQKMTEIIKRNRMRKHLLVIECSRFFHSVVLFTTDIIDDIEKDGSKCLNSNDLILFDKIAGKRYMQGYMVVDAFKLVKDFSIEVISYLDVPQMYLQE